MLYSVCCLLRCDDPRTSTLAWKIKLQLKMLLHGVYELVISRTNASMFSFSWQWGACAGCLLSERDCELQVEFRSSYMAFAG